MTTDAARKPHPALALKGFTKPVTLGTGIEVHIRKLDMDVITQAAARDAVASGLLTIDEANTANVGEQLGLAIEVKTRVLKASLVQPTLTELVEIYGGTMDEADFGLGNDMSLILEAVDKFNPQKKKPDAK
ncbi:hypothetical protein ACFFLM_04390 [Deinococcus oregonensis]|uniref:Uncharacterized protein n=1 Tax=Deinococcus oregonensis TaxID=1805970 RepID=A0ABV6AYC0_9DEIO